MASHFGKMATKDFYIKSKIYEYLRVNRFGVHIFCKPEYMNTDYGCANSFYKHETLPHELFIKSTFDFDKTHIDRYIDDSYSIDNEKTSKLKVEILNYGYPHITIFDGTIVVNGINKSDKNSYREEEIEFPKTEYEFPLKSAASRIIFDDIILTSNQYNFIHDKWNILTHMGLYLGTSKRTNNKLLNGDINDMFLTHAPGGRSHLGDYNDGKKYEHWCDENKDYKLTITISPGIKKKNASGRYPPAHYPLLSRANANTSSMQCDILEVNTKQDKSTLKSFFEKVNYDDVELFCAEWFCIEEIDKTD
jgi:hypothetical protein